MSTYVYGIPRSRAAAGPRRRRWVPAVAAGLGHSLRLFRRVLAFVPGLAGAVAISVGAWLAWPPAGLVAAGLFLLMLDRRMS